MPVPEMLRAVAALLFVLALIALLAWGLRRISERKWLSGLRAGGRLALKETLYLDSRHKLVVVGCDATEHLILLGPAAPVVIDSRPATHA
jgi:flagellar protein FliO/FliZ